MVDIDLDSLFEKYIREPTKIREKLVKLQTNLEILEQVKIHNTLLKKISDTLKVIKIMSSRYPK